MIDLGPIGNNTHLTKLIIENLYNIVGLTTTNESFYDGIRNNSSITELWLHSITYNGNDITDVAHEILKACARKRIFLLNYISTQCPW